MSEESTEQGIVFLVDVDNTLSNNDKLKADLAQRIEAAVGHDAAQRFWEIYEDVRREKDYVDFPTTLQVWSAEFPGSDTSGRVRDILDNIDFKSYLYPHAIDTLRHLSGLGTAVILSDGDQVFQRRKIQQSGLESAVGGRVLIYVHKEQELPDVFRRYPADHYVVIDDKARILSALERDCPTTFTTILVLQGKYADPSLYSPKPDLILPTIGEVSHLSAHQFYAGGTAPRSK